MIFGLVLYLICICAVCAENFPSLITTNATLAVVIDREYIGEEYDNIKAAIEAYIVYTKREILKNGGVNVIYYSWTGINVKRDITAILSIAPCADTWELFKSAEDEHLLHMAISESDCPRLPSDRALTIPLINRGEEMPQLILDIRTAETYNWKSAVVIYDGSLERDMVTRVVKAMTQTYNIDIKAAGISLIKLEIRHSSGIQVRTQIRNIISTIHPETVGSNFLIIVSYDLVDIIMEYAKQFQLVNTRNQWLYVISDTNDQNQDIMRFKKYLKEGDNVAFVYNTTKISDTCKGGIKCHAEEILAGFTIALEKAIQDELEIAAQVSDEEWEAIKPTKSERRSYLLSKIKTYLLKNGVCSNCTSWGMKSGETWGREYQQNASSESVAEILSVGNWRSIDGPSMLDELFPHVSHGFRGKTLPMVSFHNPPWQILKTNESGDVIEYSGLVFDIIAELAKNLNFTYTVEIAKFSVSINQYSNYSSTKLSEVSNVVTNFIPVTIMDMIRNKSVALGACGFTITEEKKHIINFTVPISTQTYTFLVARPRELSRAMLFISPFTGSTWLCLASAIVSMGPILYYIHRLSPVYEYEGISMKGGLSSIQNCIWYMYGALLQQGGMHLPYADSARIIVGAWWLVVLVVATTYCGNLVAFLTFPKIDIPITTVDDLLAHKETVSWSIMKGSFLEEQLSTATQSRYKTIYDGRIEMDNLKEMLGKIEDGKHVYIDWKIRLQYIMKKQYLETDRCDLALGLDEFYDEQIAMIVAQDTPYLSTINDEIKKLHQVGLIQKWLKEYLPKKDRCWKNRHIIEVNNHTVNMDDMQGSFFVLFFGFLLSLALMIGEKLLHRYLTRRKKKIIQPFTT